MNGSIVVECMSLIVHSAMHTYTLGQQKLRQTPASIPLTDLNDSMNPTLLGFDSIPKVPVWL